MRFREFITEAPGIDGLVEDEAQDPAILSLIDILDQWRFRSGNLHTVPKIRASSLINLVQKDSPQFNLATLEQARTNNELLKNLIKDIKDDDAGVKYIYLTPTPGEEESSETELGDTGAPQAPAEKIVGSMAKSALANRS
jgi:hypothetical protein